MSQPAAFISMCQWPVLERALAPSLTVGLLIGLITAVLTLLPIIPCALRRNL